MSTDSPSGPRRDIRLLVAAVVIATGFVVAVFTLGIDRPPELPLLAAGDEGSPSAAIAWTSWEPNGLCVYVAEPDATVREVTCGLDGELVGLVQDGPVQLLRYGGGMSRNEMLVTIDRETGEVLDSRATEQVLDYSAVVEPTWFRDGNELVVRHDNRDIWRVRSRDSYTVHAGRVSPDGAHIVLVDSARRIVVMPLNGTPSARVWVDADRSRSRTSPNIVLWEGESLLVDE